MDDLTVTPEYLEKLAHWQDEASQKATEAKSKTSGIEHDLTWSHGHVSYPSTKATGAAEKARQRAAASIANAATDLAAQLRDAEETYEAVDNTLRRNIDRQDVDRG